MFDVLELAEPCVSKLLIKSPIDHLDEVFLGAFAYGQALLVLDPAQFRCSIRRLITRWAISP